MNLNCTPRPQRSFRGLSLVEVVAVTAVMGILAAVAVPWALRNRESAQDAKLETAVSQLNRSLKVYVGSGGSVAGMTDAQAVIDKMKTRRNDEAAARYAGFSGAMIDKRLQAVALSDGQVNSARLRAIWNADKEVFELTRDKVEGIGRFELLEENATKTYGTEDRDESVLAYNTRNGWIWGYEDKGADTVQDIDVIDVSDIEPSQVSITGETTGDGSGGNRTTLARPLFSVAGGAFNMTEFPFTLELSNPNPGNSSEIWYQITGLTGMIPYGGSIQVQPDYSIEAYAKSTSILYDDSPSAAEYYYDANNPPTASPDTLVADEDHAANGNLLSNDSDPEGSELTLTTVDGVDVPVSGLNFALADGGVVWVNRDGSVQIQPLDAYNQLDDEENVNDNFTYFIQDAEGRGAAASVSLQIQGLDDAIENNHPQTPIETALGQSLSFYGLEAITDVDTSDNPLLIESVSAELGTVTYNEAGTIYYQAPLELQRQESPVSEGFDEVFYGVGNFTLSVDGRGESGKGKYSIQVDKPVGATVESVYALVAGDYSNSTVPKGKPIKIGGVKLELTETESAAAPQRLTGTSRFGDVTEELSGILNGLPTGLSSLNVKELDYLEGVSLFVVWNDPNAPITTASIALGSQNTEVGASGGFQTAAIDTSFDDFSVQMGFGIGYSWSGHNNDSDQYSTLEVNGYQIASAIGGEDDGEKVNGALWTVGGIGDSANYDLRDELFDVTGLLRDGDTSIDWMAQSATGHAYDWITSVTLQARGVRGFGRSSDSIRFTVRNQDGDTVSVSREVLFDGNSPPIARPDEFLASEDDPFQGNFLSNDLDPEESSLTLVSVNGLNVPEEGLSLELAHGGTVTIEQDGSLSFQPLGYYNSLDDDESVADTFSYVVADEEGLTASAAASLEVMGRDDPIVNEHPADVIELAYTEQFSFSGLEGISDVDTSDNPLRVTDASAGEGEVSYNEAGLIVYTAPDAPVIEEAPVSEGFDEVFYGVGNYTLSVDGKGRQGLGNYSLSVDKPAGASVQSVFVQTAGDYQDSIVPTSTPVKIAGVDVVLDQTETAAAPQRLVGTSRFGDVTDQLAGVLNGLSAGRSSLNVREMERLEGVSLFVVWDDPNAPITTTSIALGSQNTEVGAYGGFRTAPIDTSFDDFSVQMGFGIGYSWSGHGQNTSDQYSTLDVNGYRVASHIGGEDDGEKVNGALWTVGGIGDSAESNDYDELFDVTGLLRDGDTSIDWMSNSATGHAYDWITSVTLQAEGCAGLSHSGDSITFTVENQDGDSVSVTREVQFDHNQPPVARPETFQANEDETHQGSLTANDVDPDGSALVVLTVNGNEVPESGLHLSVANGGLVVVQADGSFEFDPQNDYQYLDQEESVQDTFGYVVADERGLTASAVATLVVEGRDDPIVNLHPAQALDVPYSTQISFSGLEGITDVDTSDNPLRVVASSAEHGTVSHSPTGTITYTAPAEATYEPEFVSVEFTQLSSSAGYLNAATLFVNGTAYDFGNSDMGAGHSLTVDVEVNPFVANRFDLVIDTWRRHGNWIRGLDTRDGTGFELIHPHASFAGASSAVAKVKDLSFDSQLHMVVGFEDLIMTGETPDWDYNDFLFEFGAQQNFDFLFGGISGVGSPNPIEPSPTEDSITFTVENQDGATVSVTREVSLSSAN